MLARIFFLVNVLVSCLGIGGLRMLAALTELRGGASETNLRISSMLSLPLPSSPRAASKAVC